VDVKLLVHPPLQLLDNKRAEDYELPVKVAVRLRPYQQVSARAASVQLLFGYCGYCLATIWLLSGIHPEAQRPFQHSARTA
jgi:hypothetical protein